MNSDVVIVGGGVVGLSLAYELSAHGVGSHVLEKNHLGMEASWAGAGILTPASLEGAREPIDRLRAHSVALTEEWSQALREETGIDNGYRPCGALEVAVGTEDRPAWSRSLEAWHQQGVPAQELDSKQLAEKEKALAEDLNAAYFLPTEAQIRNPWHLRALATACVQRGVDLAEQAPAHGFVVEGKRVTGVKTPSGVVSGEKFVVSSGAWAAALLNEVGLELKARPMRGQIVLLKASQPLLHHVIWAGPRYLVPRDEGRILVGSTMEDAGFASHPTAEGVRELLAFALRLAPALGSLEFEQAWAGLRPGSVDGLPYMGQVPGFENLYVSCGHYRAGFELAAGSALVMRELLLEQPLSVPLEAFRPER